MKRNSILLLISVMLVLSLSGCGAKLNLTKLDNTKLHEKIQEISASPDTFEGTKLTLSSNVSMLYSFGQNKIIKNILFVPDPQNKHDAYIEIKTKDWQYPGTGSYVTVSGEFTQGYLNVKKLTVISDSTLPAPQIDTLSMSAAEYIKYMSGYIEAPLESGDSGKTIALVGHCTVINGKKCLLGLNDYGETTWIIEIGEISEGAVLPEQNSKYINPVYIYGELSYYTDGEDTAACINVSSAQKVAYVMK